jgi:hypothetical protein
LGIFSKTLSIQRLNGQINEKVFKWIRGNSNSVISKIAIYCNRRGSNEVKKSKKQGNRLPKASCFPFKEEAGRIIAGTIGSPLKGGENY